MTRLEWNTVGERTFEAGVDRGVLYIEGFAGVPWNGLISISESPSGGDVTPHYIDGIKYLNQVSGEDFQATLEAFTYPEEFSLCDGTAPVKNGLFATQQSKKSFGLSYRTKVGNDVAGIEYGYKIHLVYNAIASPTDRPNNTLTDSIEPFNFSWDIFTKPPTFTGYKPTAHFIIDFRNTPSELMQQIEDILYGHTDATPRLPSVEELISIFESHESGVIDAGYLTEEYYTTLDSGVLDGGGP